MRKIKTIQVQNGKEIEGSDVVYSVYDFPYKRFLMAETVRKHNISYLNVPSAYDIETTNIRGDAKQRPFSFMYQWQWCIGDAVVFGRRWEEWEEFAKRTEKELQLNEHRRLAVYVHNLPFEFQFMRKFGIFTDSFLTDNRKVIRVLMNGCIEFRCSYALSNMSLQKFCENERGVTYYKLSDTYDYEKIRTADTPLTENEEAYYYNDVRGLCQCIESKMQEDNIAQMPLTSTGYVRRDFRKAMKKNSRNRKILLDTALTPELYTMMKEEFRGGDVHANIRWARQRIENVKSKDLQSSYPAAMMLDEFPMGKWLKANDKSYFTRDWKGYAQIFRVRMLGVKYIGDCGNPYISLSKCTKITKDRVIDNGRVLYASVIEATINDIDMYIIRREYSIEDIYVKDLYVSEYGELPQEYKDELMIYFRMKTELKGIAGKEYEYMKSKNKVNSSYGMAVTDIAKDSWEYINGEYKRADTNLKEALAKYYKNNNSFLAYQWGVWIPARARLRLREGLWRVGKDNVYDDTDSIKHVGNHESDFNELNADTIKKCEEKGAYAYDRNGKKQYLGIWDDDGNYQEFKALGSKKYIVKEKDIYKTTIAGVAKSVGKKYFNIHGIDAFDIGTTIPNSGHLVATYNDDDIHYIEVDGCRMKTASNVALIDGDYTLGVTNEWLDLWQKAVDKQEYLW